jgi:hypothetical protein
MKKSSGEILEIRLEFPPKNSCNSMGYKGLFPVLDLLEASSFPKPLKVIFAGKKRNQERKQTINSYLSPKLLAILEPNGTIGAHITIDAYHTQHQYFSVYFSQSGTNDKIVIRVDVGIVETMNEAVFKNLFLSLIDLFPNVYFAHCTFSTSYSEFHKKYMYQNNRGASYMNFLVGLQYIGAKELAIQGGRVAFEANSLLQITPLHDGLVVEVGKSLYDIFTDEGEALLAKATLSLPPVQYSL